MFVLQFLSEPSVLAPCCESAVVSLKLKEFQLCLVSSVITLAWSKCLFLLESNIEMSTVKTG